MNIGKKMFCRVYQWAFHVALPVLPYREPKILKSTDEIAIEIKKLGLKSTMIVTDEFLKKSGATESLELSLFSKGIKTVVYDKTRPNPTAEKEDIPVMSKHADREGNPLYPVPVLMDRKELEKFYYEVAQ